MRRAVFVLCAPLFLLGLLTACASTTLTVEECRAADWRATGVEDGRSGRAAAYFARYVEECQGQGAPDRSVWAAGREEGLLFYCTPAGAYAAGREGRVYAGVCPDPIHPDLLAANDHGLTWRRMRQRISDLERLETSFNPGCATGLGAIGRFRNCRSGAGLYAGAGWDPRIQAELRRLRREIAPFTTWPPPGDEMIGGI